MERIFAVFFAVICLAGTAALVAIQAALFYRIGSESTCLIGAVAGPAAAAGIVWQSAALVLVRALASNRRYAAAFVCILLLVASIYGIVQLEIEAHLFHPREHGPAEAARLFGGDAAQWRYWFENLDLILCPFLATSCGAVVYGMIDVALARKATTDADIEDEAPLWELALIEAAAWRAYAHPPFLPYLAASRFTLATVR